MLEIFEVIVNQTQIHVNLALNLDRFDPNLIDQVHSYWLLSAFSKIFSWIRKSFLTHNALTWSSKHHTYLFLACFQEWHRYPRFDMSSTASVYELLNSFCRDLNAHSLKCIHSGKTWSYHLIRSWSYYLHLRWIVGRWKGIGSNSNTGRLNWRSSKTIVLTIEAAVDES